jgi:hypothetical protein
MEQIDRWRSREAEAQANRTARANARAARIATAKAQAEAKSAARERERAQRQVNAEARREAAAETYRPTSDLMKRMGFSEQDIAAQKALEESPKPSVTASAAKTADVKPGTASIAATPAPH